jgi:arabinose-5-phosphate isomerase
MTKDLQNHDVHSPAELVRIEAAALEQLAQRLEGPQHEVFERVAALLAAAVQNGHRVVLTGIGKSGLIARKIAATLLSTGTPSQFLHPTEALHGDLGLLRRGDVLLALSYSGQTEELLRLLPVLPHLGVTLVSLTGPQHWPNPARMYSTSALTARPATTSSHPQRRRPQCLRSVTLWPSTSVAASTSSRGTLPNSIQEDSSAAAWQPCSS